MNQTHTEISYGEAINQAIREELARDERVIVMAQDIAVHLAAGRYGRVDAKRIKSVPISENSTVGLAIGAAMTGLRPVLFFNYANFVYLSADQIINQASKIHFITGGQMHVPLVIRCGMFHNGSNAAQHSDRPYSMFMNCPGLKIITPSTPDDAKGLLKSAIRDNDPVLIFEDVNLYQEKGLVNSDPDYLIPLGKADIKRHGEDVTIISIAGCLPQVLAAAEELALEGISAEVIDPRTLVPLDKQTILKSVAKTGRLVIVDYGCRTNSAASEIAAIIGEEAFESLRRPIRRVTTPDVHIPFSPALEKPLYPRKDGIVAAVKDVLGVRNTQPDSLTVA